MQADEILSLLAKVDLTISKHELSAFFRKSGHKHYRECKDQILRNFLMALQIQYRDDDKDEHNQDEKSDDSSADKITG